jgi:plasmid stabilization system protein ParE
VGKGQGAAPQRVVVVTRRALRHIQSAEAWWRQHRGSASPIVDEIDRAVEDLLVSPESGAAVHWKMRTRGLRRVILFRVGYHLYYRVNASRFRLEIVGFWHERRRPPRW